MKCKFGNTKKRIDDVKLEWMDNKILWVKVLGIFDMLFNKMKKLMNIFFIK